MKPRNPLHDTLWYSQPANRWEEALPVGNGRLGAMVWGGLDEEVLNLNEDTLWSGFPRDTINYEAARALPRVRELLAAKKWEEAQDLVEKSMQGVRCESYQPLGTLRVRRVDQPPRGIFQRGLDLGEAVAFAPGREVFASAADQVIALRWEGAGDLAVTLDCPHPHQLVWEDGDLLLTGRCPTHVADNWKGDHPWPVVYEEGLGTRFCARVAVVAQGRLEWNPVTRTLTVVGAPSVVVLVAASGNVSGPPDHRCRQDLAAAREREWAALRRRHVRDHKSYYDRMTLELGPPEGGSDEPGAEGLPTDARLTAFAGGGTDPGLVALYARFGRYLLAACSRPGTEPAHLQGLWNPHVMPPWNSDYTTNINTPMNYWPAEAANLADCHEPLFRLVAELQEPGARVARLHYGCGGWAAHHNVDFWRMATPTDGDASWAFWPMGGVWLAGHLIDHWRFSLDRSFLRDTAWPLVKGACEFALDWLVEGPLGTLTTSPSTSPENRFLVPSGHPCAVATGSTLDHSLIRHLLQGLVEADDALSLGDPLTARARDALTRLPPMGVSPEGRVLEWADDLQEAEPGHRHFSNLFGLYPGNEVAPADAALRQACQATIARRLDHGGGHTGWSCAWLINLQARLGDGEAAGAAVRRLLSQSTLPNLFDDHPPFQIDGNFGGLAGVLEMLCQSQTAEIRLLPALPKDWPEGRVTGHRARGAFTLDYAWTGGRLQRVSVTAGHPGPCRLAWPGGRAERLLVAGETWTLEPTGEQP